MILDLDPKVVRHVLGHGRITVGSHLALSRCEHPVLLRGHDGRPGGVRPSMVLVVLLRMLSLLLLLLLKMVVMLVLLRALWGHVLRLAEAGVLGAIEVRQFDPLSERLEIWTTDLLGASRTVLLLDDRDGHARTLH